MRTIVQFPDIGGYAPGVLSGLDPSTPGVQQTLHAFDREAARAGLEPVSALLSDPAGPAIDAVAAVPVQLYLSAMAASLALFHAWIDRGGKADALLGHGTGELTALCAAEAITPRDAARLLCVREAALAAGHFKGGLTTLHVDAATAAHLCATARGWSLQVSSINAPRQSAVSGLAAELDRLERIAQAAEIRYTRQLAIYPYHNRILASVARRFVAATAQCELQDPLIRVYSPLLGHFVNSAVDTQSLMTGHLTDTVDYLRSVRELYESYEVTTFVEIGARPMLSESTAEALPPTVDILRPPLIAANAETVLWALTAAPGQPAKTSG
ncbi:ACP S-malonyltransferase [Nocardia brasiliensis]|uniref:ACP S-malonyltransferase n=1 Tax=Nocardia brasiliensis TaxID=37326 RepID=UPI002458FEE0|nr:acyltransferase domain-containing protein [Nocardia brasiliensis]